MMQDVLECISVTLLASLMVAAIVGWAWQLEQWFWPKKEKLTTVIVMRRTVVFVGGSQLVKKGVRTTTITPVAAQTLIDEFLADSDHTEELYDMVPQAISVN